MQDACSGGQPQGVADVFNLIAAAARLNDPGACREQLAAAGFTDIDAATEPLGYHLKDAADWWEVV